MRIDCPKAAQAPAWLPATPRPGQVQTPQVSHLGISRSGRRGDAQDLRAASRSGHLGGFASGRTRGGHPDIRHKSTATPAAPPAGAARAGSGRRSASCRDCLRSSPVVDRTHVSLPTPTLPPHTLRRVQRAFCSASYGQVSASGPRSTQTPLGPPSAHRARPRTQIHSATARRRCRARTRRASASPG